MVYQEHLNANKYRKSFKISKMYKMYTMSVSVISNCMALSVIVSLSVIYVSLEAH